MPASSSTGSSAEEARASGELHNSLPSDREHEGAACVAGWVDGDGGKHLNQDFFWIFWDILGLSAADSEGVIHSNDSNM